MSQIKEDSFIKSGTACSTLFASYSLTTKLDNYPIYSIRKYPNNLNTYTASHTKNFLTEITNHSNQFSTQFIFRTRRYFGPCNALYRPLTTPGEDMQEAGEDYSALIKSRPKQLW